MADVATEWPSQLIRPDDDELESLAFTTFMDGTSAFQLGAGDQALASAAFTYLHRRNPGREVLVIALPRGSHDVALGVALTAQLSQLNRLAGGLLMAQFCPWKGSVVVIGHNTSVQRRLGELNVRGTYSRGGVANALRVFRLRPDGTLAEPDGTTVRHTGGSGRMLYLNTRTQWPALGVERDPLVIIDATRIGNTANVGRALAWADDHEARHVIVVTHLGDAAPRAELERADRPALVFDLAEDIRADLVHELGHGIGDAALSCNELLHLAGASNRIRVVEHDELADLLFRGLTALSQAPGNRDTWPYAVGRAQRLLTGMRRLVDTAESYNRAAALNPWLPDLATARRVVDRSAELQRPRSRWRSFATGQWGTARYSAIEAYRIIEEANPKHDALLDEIDRALRDADRQVVVRTADRAGAIALQQTLRDLLGDDAMERISVHRCGETLPWLPADNPPVTEILPGAPPAWDSSWACTAESTDRVVLAYPFEVRWTEKAVRQACERMQEDRATFFARFGFAASPPLHVPVEIPAAPPAPKHEQITLEVHDLWQRILEVDEPVPAPYADDRVIRRNSGHDGPTVTVATSDGRTHVIPVKDEVEVFVAGKYRIRLAEELQEGDELLYTTGSGRESLFTRLVAASHHAFGVDDLDLVMRRFRTACRTIYRDAGSWAEGNRRLRAAGAAADTQLQAWATGDTIAPADASDVRVVATLAGDDQLDQNWYRIEALATELRSLHQRLGRILSAAISEALDGGGPHARRVAELVGAGAAEILDEFTSATVTHIERT